MNNPYVIESHKKLIIVDAHDTVLRRDLSRSAENIFGDPKSQDRVVWTIRDGFLNFLDYYVGVCHKKVAISSDGSRPRLTEVFERFGIADQIAGIYGQEHLDPQSLFKGLDRIVTQMGVTAEETVFIGDSILDQNSAKKYGIDFIQVPDTLDDLWFSFHEFLRAELASHVPSLAMQKITNIKSTFQNLTSPQLVEQSLIRGEGQLAHLGAIVVDTGDYRDYVAADQYIVREPSTAAKIYWHGLYRPFPPDQFHLLYMRLLAFLQDRELFVQDCYVGADETRHYPLRVITQTAWHSLFVRNCFIQPKAHEIDSFYPEFTVIHVPHFKSIPDVDGTQGEAFCILHLAKKLVLIGGTAYAGELRHAVFNLVSTAFTQKDILPVQCSSNIGDEGDLALFFGNASPEKSALTMNGHRYFFGDAHHCWTPQGVFNLEWGAYPPVQNLTSDNSPGIYTATRRFATILENVHLDQRRYFDLCSAQNAPNARASFPITHLARVNRRGIAGHPRNVFILVRDGFGVLPVIAKISPEQAIAFLLIGYGCPPQIPGREGDDEIRSQPFFNGYPTLFHPAIYGLYMWERVKTSKTACWLLNASHMGAFGHGEIDCFPILRRVLDEIYPQSLEPQNLVADELWPFQRLASLSDMGPTQLDPRSAWQDKTQFTAQSRRLSRLLTAQISTYSEFLPNDICQSLALPNMDP